VTISVKELFEGSRSGERVRDGSRADARTLSYLVSGTADPDAAVDAVEAASPVTVASSTGTLKRRRFSYSPVGLTEYQVDVKYDRFKKLLVDESEYEFDIGLQNQKVYQSLGTTRYAASGTAPDYQGAINVQDSRIEGVDVGFPTYQFSITKILDAALITQAWRTTVRNLVGKKNSSAIGTEFAAGELLFLGARGRNRSEDEFQVTFSFSASANVSGLTVGNITGINKKGWDFIWFVYAEVDDSAAGRVVKRPAFAYVEKVIEDGNLNALGIW
jgi:hypothetical protein